MTPLAGLRILAVEQYGAGPFGTSYLADLGAEVVKIENHNDGGDVGRQVRPHFFGPGDSHFFQTFNRNKKSVTLDLKHPDGRRRSGAGEERRRGARQPARRPARARPDLRAAEARQPTHRLRAPVGHGRTGSRKAWPGYDYLMQAEAGHMSLTGEPGGPPTRYGLSVVDLMTGLAAAFGLLAGVMSARATGKGMDVDTSLFDVALHNLNYPGTWFLNAGAVTGRTPRSAHPSLTPSQLYRTKDGWIFIMCNKEKFWGILAQALGKSEWATDPEFATFKARLKNRDRLTQMLDAALSTRTTDEWIGRFAGKVPASPVYDVKQALEAPGSPARQCRGLLLSTAKPPAW